MKLTTIRKIWITLFSIFSMLTSSIAFSLPVMPINMYFTSVAAQNVQCNMQKMDHSTMVHQDSIGNGSSTRDCNILSDSIQDCCTDICSTSNCMPAPALITLNNTNFLSSQSNALLSPTMINLLGNSPSNSLFRPPIL